MLHLTNGDAVTDRIDGHVPGRVGAFCDVLHDGPVLDLPVDELRRVRARFHMTCGWGTEAACLEKLTAMDELLASDDPDVVVWYEHDLFDQLCLLQALPRLYGRNVTLVPVDEHVGQKGFFGLGQLDRATLVEMLPRRRPVTPAQFALARDGWAALTRTDPGALQALDGTELPYLRAAVLRLLQELPDARTGRSRTESQVLSLVTQGVTDPVELFRRNQDLEEAPWLGDWTFWLIVQRMTEGERPLLRAEPDATFQPPGQHPNWGEFLEQSLHLAGPPPADWVAANGIDRWIGGTHLTPSNDWRWDGGGVTRRG